jgi:hypothetical protein
VLDPHRDRRLVHRAELPLELDARAVRAEAADGDARDLRRVRQSLRRGSCQGRDQGEAENGTYAGFSHLTRMAVLLLICNSGQRHHGSGLARETLERRTELVRHDPRAARLDARPRPFHGAQHHQHARHLAVPDERQ